MVPGKPFRGWYKKNGTSYAKVSDNFKYVFSAGGDAAYVADTDWKITYNLNGGEVTTANPTLYNRGTNTFTLNNPVRGWKTFAGWTGTGLNSASSVVSVQRGSFGDRSYTATYNDISPDCTLDLYAMGTSDTGILKVRTFDASGRYAEFTTFSSIPCKCGQIVVLYANKANFNSNWGWAITSRAGSTLTVSDCDAICFGVPANSSGSGTMRIEGGRYGPTIYCTNLVGWLWNKNIDVYSFSRYSDN